MEVGATGGGGHSSLARNSFAALSFTGIEAEVLGNLHKSGCHHNLRKLDSFSLAVSLNHNPKCSLRSCQCLFFVC